MIHQYLLAHDLGTTGNKATLIYEALNPIFTELVRLTAVKPSLDDLPIGEKRVR
jgi:sugar (pentulose or hexulose) kinase